MIEMQYVLTLMVLMNVYVMKDTLEMEAFVLVLDYIVFRPQLKFLLRYR